MRGELSFTVVLALILAGCQSLGIEGHPGDGETDGDVSGDLEPHDGRDTPYDWPLEYRPDPGDPGAEEPFHGLLPESDGTVLTTDPGVWDDRSGDGYFPVAFSGDVYELVLSQDAGVEDPERLGVFRLASGGTTLGIDWLHDFAGTGAWYASICWTGELFTILVPLEGVGLLLLSAGEDGVLARDAEVLGPDTSYVPVVESSASFVLCPDGGPIVVDHGRGEAGVDRLHLLGTDGTTDGSFVDVDLPTLAHQHSMPVCTTLGGESVCYSTTDPDFGLVFFDRSGTVREADPDPDLAWSEGFSIAAAGDDLALTWTASVSGKQYLMFMLVDADGEVLVPANSTGIQLGYGPDFGMASVSSGEHVFVAANGFVDPIDEWGLPMVFLVDLEGHPVGDGVRLDAIGDPEHREGRGVSVFREDDAYAVLYPQGPVYRRFTVVD
jgi:hypothetical protein